MRMSDQKSIRGRGAAGNPGNRFERAHYAPDPDPQPPAIDDVHLSVFKQTENAETYSQSLPDHMPIISYHDAFTGSLKVVHCRARSCDGVFRDDFEQGPSS